MPPTSGAPKAPYLIFGFDVDPANPNAKSIIADVGAGFPITDNIASLGGIDNMYTVEVPLSAALARLSSVELYLRQKAQAHAGVLRWAVQLCRRDEIAQG